MVLKTRSVLMEDGCSFLGVFAFHRVGRGCGCLPPPTARRARRDGVTNSKRPPEDVARL